MEATTRPSAKEVKPPKAPKPARPAERPGLAPALANEALQTVLDSLGSPRATIEARNAASRAPGDLAEAQVGLQPRCARCGRPLVGASVPDGATGEPLHVSRAP
jgi:hypothetical protein